VQLLWRIAAAAVFSIILGSCGAGSNNPHTEDEKPPLASTRLSTSERKILIAGAHQLSIGMPIDQVLRILGKPTYDNIVGPKVKTKENEDKFRRILRYYLVQYGHGANSADETLEVALDRRGERVSSVTFINVGEVTNDSFTCSTAGNVRTCALRPTNGPR
jgi:hypothetical protein